MTHKNILAWGIVLGIIALGILLLFNISPRSESGTPDETEVIRETIIRARKLTVAAEYTFDTSQYATVYINDPRFFELSDDGLAQIRENYQDPSLVIRGLLDLKIAAIHNLHRLYEISMAEIRAKQANGTITAEELLILEIDTNGWPTPQPEDPNLAIQATQACEQFIAAQEAYRENGTVREDEEKSPYPAPEKTTDASEAAAYPGPKATPTLEPIICPTPTPKPETLPHMFRIPYRSRPPELVSPREFEVELYSIEIEGDIATATVRLRAGTFEYTLVKVDGQWFIAGVELIESGV